VTEELLARQVAERQATRLQRARVIGGREVRVDRGLPLVAEGVIAPAEVDLGEQVQQLAVRELIGHDALHLQGKGAARCIAYFAASLPDLLEQPACRAPRAGIAG
jgi:hypothetical protein